jgi:hypothetical protein
MSSQPAYIPTFAVLMQILNLHITDYTYGQYSIGDKNCTIFYSELTDDFLLKNALSYDKPDTGTCLELSLSLYQHIMQYRTGMYENIGAVVFCKGYQLNGFHFGKTSTSIDINHNFLLVSPKFNLAFKYGKYTFSESENLLSHPELQDSFIIDPSFKRVIPFKNGEYYITELSGEDIANEVPRDVVLDQHLKIPLFFDNQKNLWYLTNAKEKRGLAICHKSKGFGKQGWRAILIDNVKTWKKEFAGQNRILDLLASIGKKNANATILQGTLPEVRYTVIT